MIIEIALGVLLALLVWRMLPWLALIIISVVVMAWVIDFVSDIDLTALLVATLMIGYLCTYFYMADILMHRVFRRYPSFSAVFNSAHPDCHPTIPASAFSKLGRATCLFLVTVSCFATLYGIALAVYLFRVFVLSN